MERVARFGLSTFVGTRVHHSSSFFGFWSSVVEAIISWYRVSELLEFLCQCILGSPHGVMFGSTWIGHGDGDRVLAVCCVLQQVSWGVGLGGRRGS